MKKLCLLLATALCWGASHAQNGFYLAPHIGAGISQVKPSVAESPFIKGNASRSWILCFNAEVGIGYRYKNLRIQSGIQYLTSGFQLDNIHIHQDPDPGSFYFLGGMIIGNSPITIWLFRLMSVMQFQESGSAWYLI
jgi:hypothetical protein